MPSPHLRDSSLRRAIFAAVRSRVPERDAEDVVQSVLTDAVATSHAPDDAVEFKKWVMGIARHKVADYYRSRKREVLADPADEPAADSAGHDARDLLRWAERELPRGEEAEETFRTMLREGDGEKLEHVAEEGDVPAPRLRQRVSRLRRFFRERWALVAAATIAIVVGVVVARRSLEKPVPIAHEPPGDVERGRVLRREGLELCRDLNWAPCLKKLDDARALDPAGDTAPNVAEARSAADRALAPPPEPVPTTSVAPAPSATLPTPPRTTPIPTTAPTPTPVAPTRNSSSRSLPPRPPNTTSDSIGDSTLSK